MLDKIAIYQINLDARADRWEQCLANHQATGFDALDIRRFAAVRDAENGALGCAKSHLKALTQFIADDARDYCMILEDDFDFNVTPSQLQEKIDAVAAANLRWDVLLLSATLLLKFPTSLPFLANVFEARTTAGYIVRRSYAPRLLANFAESVAHLQKFRTMQPAEAFRERFAIDVHWQNLQRSDLSWYIFTPGVGMQRPSFSDIEGRHVDYKDASAI
ncbi:MAG: hypothetical protein KGI37_06175 [Alphaproteobacteria bacterium]|nr:hypothetical protein [Alphaproteobacteria bacterium]